MERTPLEEWTWRKIGAPGTGLVRPDLEAYQLERINASLQWTAEKSSFYHQRLAHSPQRLTSLAEIAALPFTTADDLRQASLGMVCVSQSRIERIVTLNTSGTTGEPKRLYFTRADQELTIDFFQHGMSTFTRPGDRVLILLPCERPGSVGGLLASGLARLGAQAIRHGPVRDPQHVLALIQAEKITGLVAAPTHALTLARFFAAAPPGPAWKPTQVLLSTDYVPPAIVSAIQSAWDCTVYNHYGTTEMGLGGGVECQARRGYHLREADLYVEIVDPRTGQPVTSGRSGEVVFTTLTRAGMPLIRYRTGDQSAFLPQPCPCATVLNTLQPVRQRYAGQVYLDQSPEDWLAMADLDDALFPLAPILNFSASLDGGPQQARLALKAVTLPGADPGWQTQALAAVMEIPALRAACQAGRLEVQVSGQEFSSATAGSLAKRKIVDQRSKTDA